MANWNLEVLVFEERGKPEYPEKNLLEQRREATRNSTHIWHRVRESNPGSHWWKASALTTTPTMLPKTTRHQYILYYCTLLSLISFDLQNKHRWGYICLVARTMWEWICERLFARVCIRCFFTLFCGSILIYLTAFLEIKCNSAKDIWADIKVTALVPRCREKMAK